MSYINPLSTIGYTDYSNLGAASASQGEGDFERMLSEAMTQSLADQVMGGAGSSNMASFNSGAITDMQATLMAGAANGQTGQNEMAMFMMLMMMQEFEGSDLAPLMTAMTSLLPGSGSGSGSGSSGTPITVGYASRYNMSSGSLGKSAASSRVSGVSAMVPNNAGLPTTPKVTGTPGNRDAATLRQVLDQFNVETAERYRPYKNGNTYCNIYVWDVTSALGVEIPHYVDRQTGAPRKYPDTAGAYELDANATHDWLLRQGASYGWKEVSAEQAQQYANAGFPAVTAWKNTSGGAGHVQMVCPSENGSYDPQRGVTVAQAGGKNYDYAYITTTMSKDKIPNVRYFVHS